MPSKLNVKELNRDFENAIIKNNFIKENDSEYLAFLDDSLTNEQEIRDIFDEQEWLGDFDAVIFGENVPEGDTDLFAMLDAFSMRIFGFWIKHSILEHTGCFNEKLSVCTNYEFLCRVAKKGNVFCINCQSDEGIESSKISNVQNAKTVDLAYTYAYVLKKYMLELQSSDRLEIVFNKVTSFVNQAGALVEFNEYVKMFLEDKDAFYGISENTAPFFIITGDDTCHGVLKDFAISLADELINLGQAVITSDKSRGYFKDYNEIGGMQFKGIIGFQAVMLESDFFKNIKGPKLQFWLDNPVYFDSLFQNRSKDYYIFCQDKFYAEHIKRFYGVENSMQFPPAGKDAGLSANKERAYDIVFIGAYNLPDKSCITDEFQQFFYDYMIANPSDTFEEGLEKVLLQKGIAVDDSKFLQILWSLNEVSRCIINYYREKTIETILESGLKLHVFGDTWKLYKKNGDGNLIIHPAVSVDESLKILGKSKIGLNVMTWHKAGMTERIANIMLSGAVCVSDETVYLKENFAQDKEIVLFSLEKLQELPLKLKKILAEDEYREQIAECAYKKAAGEHIWKKRAEDILALLDGE